MAFFRRSQDKTETVKLLRVGVLSSVKSLDPRDAQDTVSVSYLTQVFETPYLSPPDPDTRRIEPWLLVAVNGFLALVALAALVGIWFGRTGGE